jgi:hypothetical protein
MADGAVGCLITPFTDAPLLNGIHQALSSETEGGSPASVALRRGFWKGALRRTGISQLSLTENRPTKISP